MSDTIERNKQRLLEYLSDKHCETCGIQDIRCLTFDHLPKFKKSCTVSELVHKGYSWSRVMEEINKCQVLCLNCHSILEGVRGNSRRHQFYLERQSIDKKAKIRQDHIKSVIKDRTRK